MIKELTIRDNTKLSRPYASNLKAFQNGKTYKFEKGVNIIIGKNGTGKSTLIKLMADMMLCNRRRISEIPNFFLLDKPFGRDGELLDGADIKSDYSGVVYNLLSSNEMENDDIVGRAENAALYIEETTSSTGEKQNLLLGNLFNTAFKNKNIQFPIEELKKMANGKESVVKLLDYYKRNQINVTKEDFEYTFLLDEPDRNLDITNINSLYDILSFHKEYTQLICVIHNPVLIFKLSGLGHINWIELSENYLDEINHIFKELLHMAKYRR